MSPTAVVIVLLVLLIVIFPIAVYLVLRIGFSFNGRPMRFDPKSPEGASKAKSWYIDGIAAAGVPISCSFVEFDERGDYIDFNQHLDCEEKLKALTKMGKLIVVIYCHGWKNSSQSGDVPAFNCFLSKFATSQAIETGGLRVHGIYLGWRGNAFRPFVDKTLADGPYRQTVQEFSGPIVDPAYHRSSERSWFLPENLSYWNRKAMAEFKASGLPIARSIFTYAATAKGYGSLVENRVCIIGHSFGALLLERSLGQAMTGGITMGWWDKQQPASGPKTTLPFDFVLFVNSAAPAIYAKELRDFLEADRVALEHAHHPAANVPVIVSLTSTADSATGTLHPLGNLFAPYSPSLQRHYTTGIFGEKLPDHPFPTHAPIRQSEFYTTTPGHNRYLINHWIVKDDTPLPDDHSSDAIFRNNLSETVSHPDVFFTSKAQYPASAWRLTSQANEPVMLDGLPLSMQKSNYWIVTCDKQIIGSHTDIWSATAMETYAGLYRAVQSRGRQRFSTTGQPASDGDSAQTAAMPTDLDSRC